MPSGPTYYDFFGVSRTASSEQIRTAYLWMIKQYHPDLTGQPDKERAADFAAVLNQSYDVLKDPRKRARYDEFLDRDGGRLRKRKVRRALLTGETRRPRRSRWDGSSKGAAALGGMAIMLIAMAAWLPSNSAPETIQASSVAAGLPGTQTPLDLGPRAMGEEVQRAMSASPADAEITSRRCFEFARQQANPAYAEKCVVFDDAYLQWNTTGGGALSQPVYFYGDSVSARHRDALARLGSVDARMNQLREATLTLLVDEIRSEGEAETKSSKERLVDATGDGQVAEMSR